MAPLDTEQKAEVAELIKTGTNKSFAASPGALAEIKVAMQQGHDDMRVTTEAEIKTQRAHNVEVEKKYVELTQSVEAQFTALRCRGRRRVRLHKERRGRSAHFGLRP